MRCDSSPWIFAVVSKFVGAPQSEVMSDGRLDSHTNVCLAFLVLTGMGPGNRPHQALMKARTKKINDELVPLFPSFVSCPAEACTGMHSRIPDEEKDILLSDPTPSISPRAESTPAPGRDENGRQPPPLGCASTGTGGPSRVCLDDYHCYSHRGKPRLFDRFCKDHSIRRSKRSEAPARPGYHDSILLVGRNFWLIHCQPRTPAARPRHETVCYDDD
jgi:hypothetical protein